MEAQLSVILKARRMDSIAKDNHGQLIIQKFQDTPDELVEVYFAGGIKHEVRVDDLRNAMEAFYNISKISE